MANSFDSNFSRKLMRKFLARIEANRVLSKTVDTQMFMGAFNPASGPYVDIKRPHQYKSIRTSDGDLTSETAGSIISGKATATVQNYITVYLSWDNIDEAIRMDQLDEIIDPAATEMVTELETSFCDYMIKNAGLSYGTVGTKIDAWADIAGQKSLMNAIGVPTGPKYSVVNDFTLQNLAQAQTGISPATGSLVNTAWEDAVVSSPLAGIKVLASNALSTYTSGTCADRAGALAATPTATYLGAKDSMTQSLSLSGLTTGSASTIKAGEILEYTARYRTNMKTGKAAFGADGAKIKFRQTVTADAAVSTAGTATVTVTGPGIYESGGAYNTVDSALTSGDVVTILGAASTEYQPALFYQKDAFSITTVKLPKLAATDTVAWTRDGMTMRVTKWSDGKTNEQFIRFDMLPAFGTMNPFFAGKGFGL